MQTKHHTRTVIALVMAVFMLASLAGCVGLNQPSPTPTPTATPTATPTPSPTPTPTPEPTPEPTPFHEIEPITYGLSNGTTYQNEYFNIAVDVDDLWFVYTTEQYDLANNFTEPLTDVQRHQKYQMYLKADSTVLDYDAVLRTGLKEIVIKIYNIAQIKDHYPDPASYQAELSKSVIDAFEADGTKVYKSEIEPVKIAGQRASCWNMSYATKGYMVYIAQISYWKGDYNISVILISTGINRLDEMIAMFHAIK